MKPFTCDNFKKAICEKCGEIILNNNGEEVMVTACAEGVKHITCNSANSKGAKK